LVVLVVVSTPVAVILFFGQGVTVSSSHDGATAVEKLVPATLLRTFLRSNGAHPTVCGRRGRRTVCDLANGGRCEQDIYGDGSCTYPPGKSGPTRWTQLHGASVTIVRVDTAG
jgi:hypothetical protein